MPKRLVLLCAALTVCALPMGAAADEGDVAARGQAVERNLVTSLEDLARWCNGRKLFGKRDETYELVLDTPQEHPYAVTYVDSEGITRTRYPPSPRADR